jgi:hypothetical protein
LTSATSQGRSRSAATVPRPARCHRETDLARIRLVDEAADRGAQVAKELGDVAVVVARRITQEEIWHGSFCADTSTHIR